MKFAGTAGRPAGLRPDGFGQNTGNCGTAKLWTSAGASQFQLPLIGSPGVMLRLGSYQFCQRQPKTDQGVAIEN